MKLKLAALTFSTLLAGASAILLPACTSKNSPPLPLQAMDSTLEVQGKKLSVKNCSGCHLYPEPGLLDKKSWKQVLPAMKAEMEKSGMFMNTFEWLTLQDYYDQASPKELATPESEDLTEANLVFGQANRIGKAAKASATLVEYDTQSNLLFTGDAEGNLSVFRNGKLVRELHIGNIPVDVHMDPKTERVLVLGLGNFFPSEEMKGSLSEIDAAGNQKVIIDKLKRPVHFAAYDFNADGKAEYLISSFGSTKGKTNSGKVSLFYLQDSVYQEKVVKAMPGATKTVVGDFNQDGKPDFVALFSQGRESMSMFLNKGDLTFEEKPLLEFHPLYGSNSFELVDINGDSFLDIVFTNGDNSDYSTIYKDYHGVRVFLNNGKNDFKEAYFFHINGASKVIARDFDKDGDVDMVVLSMFPDLAFRAQETLVYLENKGELDFRPSYIEKEPSGEWFVMDAGDVDYDGNEDIIVGANAMLSLPQPDHYTQKWSKSKSSYSIFKNMAPAQEAGIWDKFLSFFN